MVRLAYTMELNYTSNNLDKIYSYWRTRTLYSMYFGYAFFYFTRKGLVFVLPSFMHDLHLNNVKVGLLSSILYLTYGLSKFINGLWTDRVNPRYVMAVGLIITGIINILFGLSSSLVFFAFFWLANGFFQGFGWPPCAKLLTHWYSQSERGLWWGIWSTSLALGSALVPLVAGVVATYFSWRYSMHLFGILAILMGVWVLNRLGDVPEKMGLPPIEEYKNDYPNNKKFNYQNILSTKEIFFKYIISNKYLWLLAGAYLLTYFIRSAITDWGALYLTNQGFSLLSSDSCMSIMEIGGFIGGIIAGWLSDRLFKGKRIPIVIFSCIGIILCTMIFGLLPKTNLALYSICSFGLGLFIFGPQVLIGVAAAELSHREAAGASTGFLAIFAYLGATLSGLPVGITTTAWGWPSLFILILICSITATFILLPLWSTKTTWE